MSNRFVKIEKPEYGVVLVKKSRGELSVEDVMEAIRDNGLEDDLFALFLRAPVFDGYLGEDKVNRVVLHNLTTCDICPVCMKIQEDERGRIYDIAFQEGYRAGTEAALNQRADSDIGS